MCYQMDIIFLFTLPMIRQARGYSGLTQDLANELGPCLTAGAQTHHEFLYDWAKA